MLVESLMVIQEWSHTVSLTKFNLPFSSLIQCNFSEKDWKTGQRHSDRPYSSGARRYWRGNLSRAGWDPSRLFLRLWRHGMNFSLLRGKILCINGRGSMFQICFKFKYTKRRVTLLVRTWSLYTMVVGLIPGKRPYKN